jgi:monothiol glutaredoxin
MNVQEKIKQQIESHDMILYMKGHAEMPSCGFSARAVQLLKSCGKKFAVVDVLQDDAIRQGIKVYSNWPTIPQLYIKGQLIGGSDIMEEMFQSGELQNLVATVSE